MRTFTYDAVNLASRTDQKGQTTKFIYNDLYFLMQRFYPVSPTDNFTYDLSGRMLRAERGGWLVTFIYDGANRVIQTTQNGQPITYVYNIPGRTRTITYLGGRVITEQMDFRGRLDHIDDKLLLPIVQYAYDLGNRVGVRTYRNGAVANYTYNANNWILTLDHTVGVTPIAGFAHDFDNEGNKRFEQKLQSPNSSEAYQYDKIYRLIDFKVGNLVGSTVPVPTTQTQYDLDPVGNWNKKTKDGVPENRMHSVTNEITKIDAVTILSDFNGNTNEDGQFRYNYDEENRLTTVTRKSNNRAIGQYQYDALRRIKKIADPASISSPVETRYFYDDARIIEEQNPAMTTLGTYVYGNYIDEVLTMDRGAQTFFYHQNSLWSVEAITDSSANVVERYSYDVYGFPTILDGAGNPVPQNPWGTPHSATSNSWMFTGRQLDEETGLYFYRARYYDSVKGRFLQRDPLEYVDGMNLYSIYFVPNATDPYGLGEWEWKSSEGADIREQKVNEEIEDYTQRFLGLIMPKRAILNGTANSSKGIHSPNKVWASVRTQATFDHFNSAGRFIALGWSTRTVNVADGKAWDCDKETGQISEGAWPGTNPTTGNKTSDGPLKAEAKIINATAFDLSPTRKKLVVNIQALLAVGGSITTGTEVGAEAGAEKGAKKGGLTGSVGVSVSISYTLTSEAGKSFGPFQATYVFMCECKMQ